MNSDLKHFLSSVVARQHKSKRSIVSFVIHLKFCIITDNFKVNNNVLCHLYSGYEIFSTPTPNFFSVLFRKQNPAFLALYM